MQCFTSIWKPKQIQGLIKNYPVFSQSFRLWLPKLCAQDNHQSLQGFLGKWWIWSLWWTHFADTKHLIQIIYKFGCELTLNNQPIVNHEKKVVPRRRCQLLQRHLKIISHAFQHIYLSLSACVSVHACATFASLLFLAGNTLTPSTKIKANYLRLPYTPLLFHISMPPHNNSLKCLFT